MWDWLLSIGIIIGFILTIWAKISEMSIPELIRQIKDILAEKSEDASDEVVAYYE